MFRFFVGQVYAKCDPGSGGINLGDCLILKNNKTVAEVYDSPAFLVNLITENIFRVAGIVLMFMMLMAGFKFVTGGKKGAEDARGILTSAIAGFIIMFSAYWVIQIIKLLGINVPI